MDTDWCIMCDSHCNIPGAIYCSKECELQDRLSAYPSSLTSNSSISSVSSSYSSGVNMKFERTSSSKYVTPKSTSIQFSNKVQQQPLQQQTLFYHRGPMPRYKHTTSKVCANSSNVRDRKVTKPLYVQ